MFLVWDRRSDAKVLPALVMSAGPALGAFTVAASSAPAAVAGWVAPLIVAGVGIGMAWPHLSVWAMGSAEQPRDQAVAGAAITTVQLIVARSGRGLGGVLLNLREHPIPRWSR